MAGGIVPSIEWLGERVAPYMPVVFVPGNHEFYRSSIKDSLAAGYVAAERYDDLFLLNGDAVLFEKFRFIGATLWTDFNLFRHMPFALDLAQRELDDYRCIKLSKSPSRKFTARDSVNLHREALFHFVKLLRTPDDRSTVVVSHHAPSLMSVPHEFLKEPLAASFASLLEPTILDFQPLLWVHGHVHRFCDYRIGATRVICNPRGYPDRGVLGFNPAFVVDLAQADNV